MKNKLLIFLFFSFFFISISSNTYAQSCSTTASYSCPQKRCVITNCENTPDEGYVCYKGCETYSYETVRWNCVFTSNSCKLATSLSGCSLSNGNRTCIDWGCDQGATSYLDYTACNAGGGPTSTPTPTPTPTPPGGVPGVPSGLSATCDSPGTQMSLDWDNTPGANNYNIRVDKNPNSFNCNDPADKCFSSNASSALRNSAPAPYRWRVQACNGNGCSTFSPWDSFVCLPPEPTNLSASCPSPGKQANLDWSNSQGATSYTVNFDSNRNSWTSCSNLNTGDKCKTVSDSSTNINTYPENHRFRVNACIAGECSGTSPWELFTCTAPPSTPTPTPTLIPPTTTPTGTPTPSPTPIPDPWYKLKDASFVGSTSINSPIPASPLTPYDADDPGNRYLIDNSAGSDPGVVTGQTISIGGAQVSVKNWKAEGTSYSPQYTVSKFIDYAKAKKAEFVVEISSIADIEKNKINIISGDKTIANSDFAGKRPFVLIVNGNITFSGTQINQNNNIQAVLSTGTITFPSTMHTANGLFIADSLDFGTTANQGIKIIGNAIAQSSFTNGRKWTNTKRPGLFIVFDPSHYLESVGGTRIIEMFSTVTYDWRQIQ